MGLASTFRGAFRSLGPLALIVAVTIGAGATPARAVIIASDNFNVPPYVVGPLSPQPVGGTGFIGNWTQFLASGLEIVPGGRVGRPTPINGQAGDFAVFASAIDFSLGVGQLYFSYDIDNPNPTELNSTRLDLNTSGADFVNLGAIGALSDFNLSTGVTLGNATAQTNIDSLGAHRLTGVLDFTNDRIAIFVDPTASSFYNPSNGANNANASVASALGAPIFTSYSLVDNLADQAFFDNVVFATDGASVGISPAAVPEPSTFALAAVGLAVGGLVQWRRRRRSAKTAA